MGLWKDFSGSMGVLRANPLAAAAPVRSLLRYAAWQVRSRLGRGPFVVPFVDGTRVEVERGGGSALAAFTPLHEFAEMGFLLLALRPGDRFIDVGANVGLHTVLAASTGAEVVALEPLPAARAMLERNLARNGLAGRVRVLAAGAAAGSGERIFTDGPSCLNHVVAPGETPAGATRTVRVVRLDEAAPPGRPSILKIDVEGYEAEVLRGAPALLADPALLAVIVEWQGYESRYGASGGVASLLLDHDLVPVRVDPLRRTLTPCPAGAPAANAILVRGARLAEVRARLASSPLHRIAGHTLPALPPEGVP